MTDNPYQTPEADLQGPGGLPKRPVRGVVYGLLVDLGGTILIGIIAVLGYGAMLLVTGVELQEASERIAALESMPPYTPISLALNGLGLLMSYLGGYTCLRVSRASGLGIAVILAIITTGLGLALIENTPNPGFDLSVGAIAFVATLLGGRAGLRRNAS